VKIKPYYETLKKEERRIDNRFNVSTCVVLGTRLYSKEGVLKQNETQGEMGGR
jgi:hypothetical protein